MDVPTIEALMIQEFFELKEKVSALEKENTDLKRVVLSLKQEKTCLVTMALSDYTTPRIDRDDNGNVVYMYAGGSSVSVFPTDTHYFDQNVLNRVAKILEENKINKEEK